MLPRTTHKEHARLHLKMQLRFGRRKQSLYPMNELQLAKST